MSQAEILADCGYGVTLAAQVRAAVRPDIKRLGRRELPRLAMRRMPKYDHDRPCISPPKTQAHAHRLSRVAF
jgi:hypothetical protein